MSSAYSNHEGWSIRKKYGAGNNKQNQREDSSESSKYELKSGVDDREELETAEVVQEFFLRALENTKYILQWKGWSRDTPVYPPGVKGAREKALYTGAVDINKNLNPFNPKRSNGEAMTDRWGDVVEAKGHWGVLALVAIAIIILALLIKLLVANPLTCLIVIGVVAAGIGLYSHLNKPEKLKISLKV